MKKSFSLTITNALVVLAVIGIVWVIARPTINGGRDHNRLQAAAASARGVVKICSLFSTDDFRDQINVSSWPGTNATDLALWMSNMTRYASTNDLMKVFSAGKIKATSWITNTGPNTNAYYIYPVTNGSDSNTVLFTSRNYLLPTKGNGPALIAGTEPFGNKGAIVVKKNGDTQIITPRQATQAVSNIGIVEGAPLN